MKNLYIFLLLLVGVVGFGQTMPEIDMKLSPNGYFEKVFDQYGNQYDLKDLKAGEDVKINQNINKNTLITCDSGIFELYFETGSGMEDAADTSHNLRRDVVCRVFKDISDFINTPLKNAGNVTKVKIWVRNIANIQGVPSNVLGLATTFYTMPQNTTLGFGGIVDGEVFKTIQGGKDSYVNTSAPITSNEITSGLFYHGMMAFNFNSVIWNTNLLANAGAGQYDLYTIMLHEMTHALGFGSLISWNGNSRFPNGFNYYSRYDTFLKNSNNSQSLIDNNGACSEMYNYFFNVSDSVLYPNCALTPPVSGSSSDQTNCNTAIKFIGTSSSNSVYTSDCFEASSLSHFEDMCLTPDQDDTYFVMSNAAGTGSISTKRYLKPEERNALMDIGYSLNTTFGNNSLALNSYINYGGTTNIGNNVAGINDGINALGFYSFTGNSGSQIIINNILSNDYNANTFECLQDVFDSSATFSTTSGIATTTINYSSTVTGLHLLRYVPVNSIGKRGNITYIYVYINEVNNCAVATSCNLVLNGNFEQYSILPTLHGQIERACGWFRANSQTPDYYHHLTPADPNSGGAIPNVPCSIFGYENDNISGNGAFAGMFTRRNGLFGLVVEPIGTKLSTILNKDESYQLSFDLSLAEGESLSEVKIQIYLTSTQLPLGAGIGYLNLSGNNGILLNSTDFATSHNGWQRITFQIPKRSLGGEQYLYIGSLSNPEFRLRTPITTSPSVSTPDGCLYSGTDNTYTSREASYYYIDNVSLIPSNGISLELPSQVCNNELLSNLSIYLSAPTNGIFSGNGVTNISGFYSFNASTAGVGTHIITYTYTNSSGCSISMSDTIIVTAATVPTFDPISAICQGATPSLPNTSTNTVGITGTWTLVSGTTYTFIPNTNQCATNTTVTVVVLPANDPSCVTDPCLPNLTLNTPEINSTIIYKRLNWIETNTNYTTSISQDVKMKAGDFINLKSGTHIKSGSLYLGKIETCTTTSKISIQETKISEVENKSVINIYPNPTKESVTITSTNSKIKSIAVSSIEGKTFFVSNNVNNEESVLDASNYQNGIYIITIETIDNKIVRQKLIKN